MLKLSIKPVWVMPLTVMAALVVAVKLALALTEFVPADAPIGYVAQDEITSYNLKSGNEILFRGQYERDSWSGDLFAYPVDALGNVNQGAPWWNAAEEIDKQNYDTGRFIATMKDDGTGVPFRLGNLSVAQQALFSSPALMNFLRGDTSGEGTTFRDRSHVLGDLVHSRPLYVADAINPTVFVGSNDGMLHAINASTVAGAGGRERWAYVPSMLLPKLKRLAVTPYVHDYYVDGQINVATISSGARTVLVGALGAGGKGLYALDITGSGGLGASSESDVASKAMWEITPAQLNYASPTTANAYVNLGYTYGTVTMAKVAGVDAVIVGNGYNDGLGSYAGCTHATPGYANCGGNYAAYLYVINAATGQLIRAIKAGADGTAASPNGLSTAVAVDSDGDGSVDRVYAGDLNGTMWKFDLATGTATALLTTSPAQAITSTPGVAVHPEGGYMVTFGTGKMLVAADTTDSTEHYAYGVWDGAPALNAALLTQTLSERSYTAGSVTTRLRRVTSNQPVWTSGVANHRGWKVALPPGERVVGEGSFIENGRFYFTGYNPTLSTTVPGTTTVVRGENWLMELDYLSGGSKNLPFLDLSGDVKLDNNDRIKYTASDSRPDTTPPTIVGDPILTTDGIPVGKFVSIGLMSQPILVQLLSLNDTLFNQNPDITIPPVTLALGVNSGHFDQDMYYGPGLSTAATGTVSFTYEKSATAKNVTELIIVANGETLYSGAPGNMAPRNLDDFLDGKSSANYTITKNIPDNHSILISAKTGGPAWNGPVTVTITTVGGSSPGYTKVDLAGGADPAPGDTCLVCTTKKHLHQYDDQYDVTGVNFLNPSNITQLLSNGITSTATQFKVLAQNQYLSPAAKLHIGKPAYLFDVDAGYIRLKDYVTSATLDLATLPTYVRNPASASYIGSFAINFPTDALSAKDWWGNGDVRAGLHPTQPPCVRSSYDATDGNMYQPVVPPGTGATAPFIDGPGVAGWSAVSTAATALGVRHNGALTIQVIAANTPNVAIEQSVPGRPEYGWRVKSALHGTYVLTEMTTIWHHPNGLCYHQAGWTKNPGPDLGTSASAAKVPGSTDPHIGQLGVGAGTIVSTTTTVAGNVTTTVFVFSSGLQATIVRTTNSDGSVTIVTTDTDPRNVTTQVVANTAGAVKSGGDERGLQARTGRISWRELVAP